MTTTVKIAASDFLSLIEAQPKTKLYEVCISILKELPTTHIKKTIKHLATLYRNHFKFFTPNERTIRRQGLQIWRCVICVKKH